MMNIPGPSSIEQYAETHVEADSARAWYEQQTAHIIELKRRFNADQESFERSKASHEAYSRQINEATSLYAFAMSQILAMLWAAAINPNLGKPP